ncbi:MAG TPA: thiamine pyrophosphate-dependent dehydrogenase E1 component subunit alpha [Steroidobacteraceae bacterium]|nr:thiamine pyrophosphate-dependent dehydrogenase E1 component subunit alpha [Steroidobacteraceae bacterium]
MSRTVTQGELEPARPQPDDVDQELLERLYFRMFQVRCLEQELRNRHKLGEFRGAVHCCDGQEAVGVGAAAALRAGDVVTSTHRGHAHYIGSGASIAGVVAEIYGRITGPCRGRAGHMHVADVKAGLLGGNGIVGGGLSLAAGQAWAFKTLKARRVAMCFFGDGAAQTGAFHETLNIASLWKLPVVFVCDHNDYGLTVRASVQSAVADIADRAAAYAMPGVTLDGNDVMQMYETARMAVERARAGEGPTLIEAKTYRTTGFSTSDVGGYQPAEEIEIWKKRDPIARFERDLVAVLGERRLMALQADARQELDEAFTLALEAPYPDKSELFEPEFGVS